MKRKTPQQKKAESLARDRRSVAEYPKAARKGVPRAKAQLHRRYRRKLKLAGDATADELREPAEAARVRKSGCASGRTSRWASTSNDSATSANAWPGASNAAQ